MSWLADRGLARVPPRGDDMATPAGDAVAAPEGGNDLVRDPRRGGLREKTDTLEIIFKPAVGDGSGRRRIEHVSEAFGGREER